MHRMVSALLAGSAWAFVALPSSSHLRTSRATVAAPRAVIALQPYRTPWALSGSLALDAFENPAITLDLRTARAWIAPASPRRT